MVEHFVEVWGRRGLKINADKSKGMVLGVEDGWGAIRISVKFQIFEVF